RRGSRQEIALHLKSVTRGLIFMTRGERLRARGSFIPAHSDIPTTRPSELDWSLLHSCKRRKRIELTWNRGRTITYNVISYKDIEWDRIYVLLLSRKNGSCGAHVFVQCCDLRANRVEGSFQAQRPVRDRAAERPTRSAGLGWLGAGGRAGGGLRELRSCVGRIWRKAIRNQSRIRHYASRIRIVQPPRLWLRNGAAGGGRIGRSRFARYCCARAGRPLLCRQRDDDIGQ